MAMRSWRPGPKGGNPALEAAGEQERVDAVDEGAQPALAWDAVVEGREAAQNGEVVLAPGDDVIEVVARSKGRAGDQQQHLVKGVEHAPWLAVIAKGGKLLEQQAQAVARNALVAIEGAGVDAGVEGAGGIWGHDRAPCQIKAGTESPHSPRRKKHALPAV